MLVAYIVVVYKRQMPIVICHEQMAFAILGCLIELVTRKKAKPATIAPLVGSN